MKKIELGDVFEINTSIGKGYFQCVKIDTFRWYIIKVFNKLYDERPSSINNVINVNDSYFIGFALKAALKKKLVEKIDNIPLSPDFELPKFMRIKHIVQGDLLGWYIVDTTTWERKFVQNLSVEQKKLSPWGIWNDTLLKQRLEKGWNLNNWS